MLDDAVTSVAVEGSHAYLGAGPRLVVVDVSAPEHLSVVGSTEVLPCKLTAVAVSGNHAFLAGGCGGLRVLDISDADSPKDVGSFRPPGEIVTVSVAGDYVFAGERDLVHMLDVCDPKASREVASCRIARPAPKAAIEAPGNLAPSLPPRAPEITVVNNYACLAVDGKMLQVLDISDPTTVKELYRYEDVPARQVAAYGNHVLAMFGGGLCVVDLSPLAWAARMPYLAALALVVSVALALIVLRVRRSLSRRLIQAEGGTEFAADLWTLRKRRKFLSRCLLGLVLLVVALPPALLMLVPKVPCVVGRYAPPGIAQGLAVAGHHAYLVGGGDDGQGSMLWTLDLSDPASPREVGSCELSEQWAGDLDVAVASDYAYVVDDSHSLTVVNVADATVPVLAGSHRESIHSTNPQAIAAAGRHVLVADGHWGMRVFDVKDPASPTPVCHYDSPLGP